MSQEQRRILLVVLVPLFMSLLSVSIVNVMLPSIETSLDASASALQWILAGYTLAFGVLLVPSGRAGDVYGRGVLFVLGVAVFGLASLLAGFASDGVVLNVARVLMGIGSGFLNPQVVGLIQQYFEGELRGRAYGIFGAIVGVSVAIGPVLGGFLVQLAGTDWGWRWSFLINVPFAVAGIVAAVRWLPVSAWQKRPAASEGSRRRRADLDPVGIALLAAATLGLILPFLQPDAGSWVWLLLLVGALLLGAWVRWEQRYKARGGEPMVDLAIFSNRAFSNGSLLIGIYFVGMTSVWVVIAIYMQSGLGYSALQAGLIGMPSAFASAASAAIAGRHVVRVGRKLVLFGIGSALVGLATSALVILLRDSHGISIWWLLVTLSFIGVGQGAVISPNQTLTLMRVPLQYSGAAGGILQTGQRMGTAIGLAVFTALFFAVQAARGWTAAAVTSFVAIGLVIVVSGVVGIVDLRREHRTAV